MFNMYPSLEFKSNRRTLTLGVETELQLVDAVSGQLVPRVPELLSAVRHRSVTGEMFQSTIEVITGVCCHVTEVREELLEAFRAMSPYVRGQGLRLSGTGTHPWADYDDRLVTVGPRYHELTERNQWLIRRMAVYGLHVHLGMANGDQCIRFNNFFLRFIPHLIALSASSPFWRGLDTGLAAARPTAYEAHPTSGLPYSFNNWEEFLSLYDKLVTIGSIQSMKDIWWDIRPSPFHGTLEIRVCDGPATLHELEVIVTFIHLLAHWYDRNAETFAREEDLRPQGWWLRENKWRAIRYGLDAVLVRIGSLELVPVRQRLFRWMERLSPLADELGYPEWPGHMHELVTLGNSADRQRAVYRKERDLHAVIRHNLLEFESGRPDWSVLN